eukprot:TRINITY_DN75195_c0_g1_i1.p1 TRINITY_DN75195_c0_g1~~TRINITY_DN75195_c0_g1_i1.p1  ORF type:complete len:304 (+),score=26.24 TRINITY_DN75195_c0_g1_i1:35-946(+)
MPRLAVVLLLLVHVACNHCYDDKLVLRVALGQLHTVQNITANVRKANEWIAKAASKGAEIVTFPECALTSYNTEYIKTVSKEQLQAAVADVASTAKQHSVYVVLGTPYYKGSTRYNMAVVINPRGAIMYTYQKIQLAGKADSDWAAAGDQTSIFPVKGFNASIIICHDVRFPELVRLPVLRGSRVIFFISCESPALWKENNYKVQVQARAEENMVWVVHTNTPYASGCTEHSQQCSHGQSLVASPNGTVVLEATRTQDQLLIQNLDMRKATAGYAHETLHSKFDADWVQQGVEKVGIVSEDEL